MSVKRTERVHKTPSRHLEVTLPEVASVAYLNIVSDHIIDNYELVFRGPMHKAVNWSLVAQRTFCSSTQFAGEKLRSRRNF